MKTLEKIIKQRPVYLNDWKENKLIGVISDFEDVYLSKSEYEAKESPYPNKEAWEEKKARMKSLLKIWKPIRILFASYGYENYSGDAFVLFERDGKLFEVNGGHCSCYGLEGQWTPEEVTLPELKHRLIKGTLGQDDYCGNPFSNELKAFLGV